MSLHYNIMGPGGTSVASGLVSIPNAVPAGDSRTFNHIKLCKLTEQATRMQAEIVDLQTDGKSNLTPDQESRFIDAVASQKGEEKTAAARTVHQRCSKLRTCICRAWNRLHG